MRMRDEKEQLRIKKDYPNVEILDKALFVEFGVSTDELCERKRHRRITMIRIAYTNLAKVYAPFITTTELGILVARNHSAICWHLKQSEGWLLFDKPYKEIYQRLEQSFKQLKSKQNGME